MAPDLLSQLRKKISGKPSVDVIFGDHISIDHNGNSTYSTTHTSCLKHGKSVSRHISLKNYTYPTVQRLLTAEFSRKLATL
jgi:hypothetical protein